MSRGRLIVLVILVIAGAWTYFHFLYGLDDLSAKGLLDRYADDYNPIAHGKLLKRVTNEDRKMLVTHLTDSRPRARIAAMDGLVQFLNRDAIGLVSERLYQDEDPAVRAAAAEDLGGIKDIVSIENLIFALDDDDDNVRRACRRSLFKLTDSGYTRSGEVWKQWWEIKHRHWRFP